MRCIHIGVEVCRLQRIVFLVIAHGLDDAFAKRCQLLGFAIESILQPLAHVLLTSVAIFYGQLGLADCLTSMAIDPRTLRRIGDGQCGKRRACHVQKFGRIISTLRISGACNKKFRPRRLSFTER